MSARPPVFTWNEELHFGPSSEPISIQRFIHDAEALQSHRLYFWSAPSSTENVPSDVCKQIADWKEWEALPEHTKTSIEQGCCLDDMKFSLTEAFYSQKRMRYLQTLHADAIAQLGISPQKRVKGKGKQRDAHSDPDLQEFRKFVESNPLKMWNLEVAAKPYVRSGHVSDQNALDTLKLQSPNPLTEEPAQVLEVLITLTTYTRNTCNTLEDIWSCISCGLKGNGTAPTEVTKSSADHHESGLNSGQPRDLAVSYENRDNESDAEGAVMVIEDVAYFKDSRSVTYADKLLFHLQQFKHSSLAPNPPPPPPLQDSTRRFTKFDSVPLRTLTLRINEPYWALHHGSCEHWFVLDEIRLQNPMDPVSGYPIGLQRTPVSRPLCRICFKVPATLAVQNDVRLDESPCVLCCPCWELFGGTPQPQSDTEPIVVVPIVFEK